ncbi:MAG: response regulator transcription factor [Elusimicrobia bacterium]|nr:response regulator transcription factor [Elusimicrobiota bacterium]
MAKGKGSSAKSKVYIVDDHAIVRQGLAQYIAQQKDFSVCGQADGGRGALEQLASCRPDAIIVDLNLKDMSGLDLIRELHARRPELAILVLSMHEESLYAERSLRAGAKGYLMKSEAVEKVGEALQQVLAGQVYAGHGLTAKLLKRLTAPAARPETSPMERLSDRKLEVFQLLGQGLTTRLIAERLGRSIKTIETYRENIKRKLDLKNAVELVYHAVQWSGGRQPSAVPPTLPS